jgi:hypothetical protein
MLLPQLIIKQSIAYILQMLKTCAQLLLLLAVVGFQSCRTETSKEDSIKHIRAFDMELINLAMGINNTISFKLLQKISTIKNVPLPFISHRMEQQGKVAKFDFETHKGVYILDSLSNSFIRINSADSIIIEYPGYAEDEKVLLIISDYAEEAGSSNVMLPLRLVAAMYIGNMQTLNIDHSAGYRLQLPSFNKTIINIENYSISARLRTRLRHNHIRADIEIKTTQNHKELLLWETQAKLRYIHPGTYALLSVDSQFSSFPLVIKASINSAAIQCDIIDYYSSFNTNSNIGIFRQRDNAKIGTLKLKERKGSDTFNPAVLFNDGTIQHLDEFTLVAERILNFKHADN